MQLLQGKQFKVYMLYYKLTNECIVSREMQKLLTPNTEPEQRVADLNRFDISYNLKSNTFEEAYEELKEIYPEEFI